MVGHPKLRSMILLSEQNDCFKVVLLGISLKSHTSKTKRTTAKISLLTWCPMNTSLRNNLQSPSTMAQTSMPKSWCHEEPVHLSEDALLTSRLVKQCNRDWTRFNWTTQPVSTMTLITRMNPCQLLMLKTPRWCDKKVKDHQQGDWLTLEQMAMPNSRLMNKSGGSQETWQASVIQQLCNAWWHDRSRLRRAMKRHHMRRVRVRALI